MYDTHIIMIFIVSIYHVYLSPILFSPYPEKKNWRKKTLEKILLSNAVSHHEGGGHIFFGFFQHFTCSTKHCALHIVVLNEYLVKNDLGRGTKVFTSLFLWSSLNLEFLFHGGSYVCGASPYLFPLLAIHTTQAMDWKSQALESIYHLNFIMRDHLRFHGFPETKGSQITYG